MRINCIIFFMIFCYKNIVTFIGVTIIIISDCTWNEYNHHNIIIIPLQWTLPLQFCTLQDYAISNNYYHRVLPLMLLSNSNYACDYRNLYHLKYMIMLKLWCTIIIILLGHNHVFSPKLNTFILENLLWLHVQK